VQEFYESRVFARGSGAELAQKRVPIRVLAVQAIQCVRHPLIGDVCDNSCVSNVVSCGACEPPRELKQDAEALVRVVHRSDLQLRQIEPLTEHVNADNDAVFARPNVDDILDRRPVIGVDEQWRMLRASRWYSACSAVARSIVSHRAITM